jgi:hypothetical protein
LPSRLDRVVTPGLPDGIGGKLCQGKVLGEGRVQELERLYA